MRNYSKSNFVFNNPRDNARSVDRTNYRTSVIYIFGNVDDLTRLQIRVSITIRA